MKKLILSLVVIATALLVQTDSVDGERPLRRLQRFYTPQNRAATVWHGQYYNATYGMPQAMVLPPNVNTMRSQGWGVCGSQMMPIYSQYGAAYPGTASGVRSHFFPTPNPPSHTQQFGIYYIRGPW
jgi:hypothetical protein